MLYMLLTLFQSLSVFIKYIKEYFCSQPRYLTFFWWFWIMCDCLSCVVSTLTVYIKVHVSAGTVFWWALYHTWDLKYTCTVCIIACNGRQPTNLQRLKRNHPQTDNNFMVISTPQVSLISFHSGYTVEYKNNQLLRFYGIYTYSIRILQSLEIPSFIALTIL